MTFAVRTAAQPASMATAMRRVLQEVDRNQPAQSITTMTDLVATTTAEPQFQTRLIAIFAMLALLLAAIGVYGVLACAVAERTREIGIRMALGAEKSDITRMVLRRSLLLATVGVVTRSSRRFGRHSRPRKVPVRSEAHRPSDVPRGSRVTRGCRAPRRPGACATRHQSGSSDRFEVGVVLAPRAKAGSNQLHNGLSQAAASLLPSKSISPAKGYPSYEEVQYEARVLSWKHSAVWRSPEAKARFGGLNAIWRFLPTRTPASARWLNSKLAAAGGGVAQEPPVGGDVPR